MENFKRIHELFRQHIAPEGYADISVPKTRHGTPSGFVSIPESPNDTMQVYFRFEGSRLHLTADVAREREELLKKLSEIPGVAVKHPEEGHYASLSYSASSADLAKQLKIVVRGKIGNGTKQEILQRLFAHLGIYGARVWTRS